MEHDVFITAKNIKESIARFTNIKNQVEKMRVRDNDEEFNTVRQTAHDFVTNTISLLEDQFKNL